MFFAFFLLGCALALPDAHHAQERIAGDGIATTAKDSYEGVLATIVGSVSMAVQTVWFENQVNPPSQTAAGADGADAGAAAVDDGVAWPAAALAAWGLVANIGFLLLLDSRR